MMLSTDVGGLAPVSRPVCGRDTGGILRRSSRGRASDPQQEGRRLFRGGCPGRRTVFAGDAAERISSTRNIDQLRPPAVPQRPGGFHEGVEERLLFLAVPHSRLLFKSSLDKPAVLGFLLKYPFE
jgi:hypothetical protein